MNRKEWNKACKDGYAPRRYDNASIELQKSLKYNSDQKATVRHHLRDTEEQRKYNNEHYELWGFEIDEDSNEHFEYGKYIIFVTQEEHIEIHRHSDETRKKIKDHHKQFPPMKGKHHTEEAKQKISEASSGEKHHSYGKKLSEETKMKISENNGRYWNGKHLPEETRRKLSEANKGKILSDEHKKKIGNTSRGRTHSDSAKQAIGMCSKERWNDKEYRRRLIASMKDAQQVEMRRRSESYHKYKENGGELKWNEFQKIYSTIERSIK